MQPEPECKYPNGLGGEKKKKKVENSEILDIPHLYCPL